MPTKGKTDVSKSKKLKGGSQTKRPNSNSNGPSMKKTRIESEEHDFTLEHFNKWKLNPKFNPYDGKPIQEIEPYNKFSEYGRFYQKATS